MKFFRKPGYFTLPNSAIIPSFCKLVHTHLRSVYYNRHYIGKHMVSMYILLEIELFKCENGWYKNGNMDVGHGPLQLSLMV